MDATRLKMEAKIRGQTTSAMTTASTMTTHDVMSGRFWPSICFQQKEMVSFAEAVGNSDSSATEGFLYVKCGTDSWSGGRVRCTPSTLRPGLRME
jgi:glucose-6-phosphate 1-dehydrogenase